MKKRNPWVVIIILAVIVLGYLFRSDKISTTDKSTDFDRSDTRLILTRHAKCRMDCRHIDESEIKEILQNGKINYNKSEPDSKPDPKYAVEGLTHDKQEVRIIFAPSSRGMVVVTVIDLNQEWQCDCK